MPHEEDHLADDARERMKAEVDALTPTQRKEYAKLIAAAEPPAPPDFGSMNNAEFEAAKRKYGA